MSLWSDLTDILHRIVHSSAAAETEKIALHGAINELDKNKPAEDVAPEEQRPADTEAKESE
jgi:hypothetical protein